MEQTYLSSYELFKIVWWLKRKTMHTRTWECLSIILAPSLYSIGFIFLQLLGQTVEQSPQESVNLYEPIDLKQAWKTMLILLEDRKKAMTAMHEGFQHNVFLPRLIVGYAPDKHPGFVKIMNLTATYLEPAKFVSFTDCATLRSNIISQNYISGVCLEDITRPIHHYLGIRLIYPSELRIYNDTYIGNVWNTRQMFPTSIHDRRFPDSNDGGYMGYIREGFISLQNAISMSYTRLLMKGEELPEILMQRFPRRNGHLPFIESWEYTLPLITVLGYMCSITLLLKMLFDLKGDQRRLECLKMLGITNWINFATWISLGTILLLIASILHIVLLKIRWMNEITMWSNTPFLGILLFLGSYSVAMLSFSYMLFTLFCEAKLGIVFAVMIMFASSLPQLVIYKNANQSYLTKILIHMIPNSVMPLGYQILINFEEASERTALHSELEPKPIDLYFDLGYYLAIFWALSVFYALLGLGMQQFRVNTTLYNVIKSLHSVPIHRAGHYPKDTFSYYSAHRHMTRVYQVKSYTEVCTVNVKGVTKMFNGKVVVDKLTLELYSGEIAVLMGHNGSGKTTLISMIAGIIEPTRGTIVFHGSVLQRYISDSPKNICTCIEDNILIDDLNAYNQLRFFCRIKGHNVDEIENEVKKYLNVMNLNDQSQVLTKNMPIGMKKFLAVCCTLIGGSKIVILDEPSSGMDHSQRRLMWKMLNNEKHVRTILLTSHSISEAETLGDRVLIMAHGQLKCDGSPFFLKNIYGSTLRLVCRKKTNCDPIFVTKSIRQYIPGIVPEYDLGTELSFVLPNKNYDVIQKIIRELESNYAHLSLENCAITESSIEDIFFRMGTEYPGECDRTRNKQIAIGQSIYPAEYADLQFVKSYQRPSGMTLWCIHLKTVIWKHYLYHYHNKAVFVARILFPIFIVLQLFALQSENVMVADLNIDLYGYPSTVTILEHEEDMNNFSTHLIAALERIPFKYGGLHRVRLTNEDFGEYMLKQQSTDKYRVNKEYLFGATIRNDTIIVWFNNYPLHAAPLGLTMIYQQIISAHVDKNTMINVTLEPLPYSYPDTARLLQRVSDKRVYLNYYISIATCFLWPISVVFLVEEQQTKQKLLELMSGLYISAFWFGTFLSDFLRIILDVLITFGTIWLCLMMQEHGDTSFNYQYRMDLIIAILYITCNVLPFNYLLSLFFKDKIAAYVLISNVHAFFVCLYILPDQAYCAGMQCVIVTAMSYETPHYALIAVVTAILRHGDVYHLCTKEDISIISKDLENCQVSPICCAIVFFVVLLVKYDWMAFFLLDADLFRETRVILGVTAACWIMIAFIETRYSQHRQMLFRNILKDDFKAALNEHKDFHAKSSDYSERILHERVKMNSIQGRVSRRKPLICENVYKRFDNKTAVRRTNLVLERGEIFGFIGPTGCGKSTVLNLLVGAERLTYGSVLIDGVNINKNAFEIYRNIGYCSQADHLPPTFRVKELLKMFCMLSGMPQNVTEIVCENLAKVFGFYSYYKYNDEYKVCSCGIKRRISCAIALLGNPSIIFFDEPFSHVDPSAKRYIRNILCKLRNLGKTIILATLSSQECEILCDRISVMSNGSHLYIGNPFAVSGHLISGYNVYLLKKGSSCTSRSNFIQVIEDFITSQFQDAIIYFTREKLMKVFIPYENTHLADLIGLLYDKKFELDIDDIEITRKPLFNFLMLITESRSKLAINLIV